MTVAPECITKIKTQDRLPRGPKLCLHDDTSSPLLRDVDKTLLCPFAAQCAGRPSPTETFLGVTKLFHGASLAEEVLERTGNFTDGILWPELQLYTVTMSC